MLSSQVSGIKKNCIKCWRLYKNACLVMRHKHRMPANSLVKQPSSYQVCGQFIEKKQSVERKTRTCWKSRAVNALLHYWPVFASLSSTCTLEGPSCGCRQHTVTWGGGTFTSHLIHSYQGRQRNSVKVSPVFAAGQHMWSWALGFLFGTYGVSLSIKLLLLSKFVIP